MMRNALFLLSLPLLAAPAAAETVHRLSDEEIAAIEASPGISPDAAALLGLEPEGTAELGGERPDRQVHGEIGIEIGTGGYRGLYGSALVPLGEEGFLSVDGAVIDHMPYRRRRFDDFAY